MINQLRGKGLNSVVMGSVIVATVAVFVIQFNPSSGKQSAKLSQACAARVRAACIEPKDHRGIYYLLMPRDQSGNRLVARAQSMGLARKVLDGLIERELLCNEAERIGLTVGEQEVNDEIIAGHIRLSLPSDDPGIGLTLGVHDGLMWDFRGNKPLVFFRDPKTKEFDKKAYERNLKGLMGRSPVEYREQQEREMLAGKMRDLVRAPVRVSELEALGSYLNEKSSASVSYIEVKESFVERYMLATPTDAEVDAWAKEATNAKMVEDTIKSKQASPLGPKENHLRHILIKAASPSDRAAALQKLSLAYWRIKRGEAFVDVAKSVSQDSSAQTGGDLGDKTDSFVLPFKRAADALKPGEMTEKAIETQFGYHLIMRDDLARFTKDSTRDLYIKAKRQELTRDLAAKILVDVKAGKPLDDVIKPYTTGLKSFALLDVVLDESLSHDDVTDGGVDATLSDASKSDAGVAKKIIAPEEDSDRLVAATSSSFNPGGDPIASLGESDNQKVITFAFASKEGDVMPEVVHGDGAFLIIKLKEHHAATRDDFLKDRDTYMQTLLVERQQEALALYVKRLLDAAKQEITRDDSYMAEFSRDAGVSDDDEPQ